MLFSIITVALNDVHGLQKTYESLARQIDFEFEWVIIDGSSDADSIDFLKNLRPDFDLTFASRPPEGIYRAMDQGVSISRGEWLLFLNAGDTLLYPKVVSLVKKALEKEIDFECLAFGVAHFSKSGYLYNVSVPKAAKTYWQLHHQGAVIAKAAYQAIGGYDTNLKWAADGKLLDSLVSRGGVQIYNETLVGFEIGGASAVNYRKVIKEIETYRKLDLNKFQLIFLDFKNFLKLLLIRIESSKFGFVSKYYFKFREKKIVAKYSVD
jgi:glycosyltransferase involved in cell wall biosynthesis